MDRLRLVGRVGGRARALDRSAAAATIGLLLRAPDAFAQGAMDDADRGFRQALRWPVEMATEHWYYIVFGVVVILLVRSYLRK